MQIDTHLESLAEANHTGKVSVLQRFWIGALLLQLGLVGMTMSATPTFDTGAMSMSVGALLSLSMFFALAFYGVRRWEHAKLARMPVEITDVMSNVGGPSYRYVFANPSDVLARALEAETGPLLLRLALICGVAFTALMTRYRGAPLPLSLGILAISLYVEWTLFPTLRKVIAKLERVKGVRLVGTFAPLVDPPIHFVAPTV